MKTNKKLKKPPKGLPPKYIVKEERLDQIREAIMRYNHAELKIPIEWIQEYNELIDNIK